MPGTSLGCVLSILGLDCVLLGAVIDDWLVNQTKAVPQFPWLHILQRHCDPIAFIVKYIFNLGEYPKYNGNTSYLSK